MAGLRSNIIIFRSSVWRGKAINFLFLVYNYSPCFFFQIIEARKHIYSKMLAFDGSTIMITLQQTDRIIEFAYTIVEPSKAK